MKLVKTQKSERYQLAKRLSSILYADPGASPASHRSTGSSRRLSGGDGRVELRGRGKKLKERPMSFAFSQDDETSYAVRHLIRHGKLHTPGTGAAPGVRRFSSSPGGRGGRGGMAAGAYAASTRDLIRDMEANSGGRRVDSPFPGPSSSSSSASGGGSRALAAAAPSLPRPGMRPGMIGSRISEESARSTRSGTNELVGGDDPESTIGATDYVGGRALKKMPPKPEI